MSGPIGVVGLGIMGSAYARNLLKAGFEVVGCDIDATRLDALAAEGLRPAASPAVAAQEAGVVITSLPSPAAFHAVMTGGNGLAGSGRAGLVVADTCTLALDDKLAARDALADAGIILLDCPVSGTGAQAARGDLSILGSGDEAAFETARPALAAISRSVHHIGPFGDGSKMKYIANLLVAIHNVSAAEAMVLGMKAGIPAQTLYDVLTDGAGTSRILEVRGPMMVSGDYDGNVSATMTTQDKDMGIIGDFIAAEGAATPLFDATKPLYKQALETGLADSDTASVAAILGAMSGLKR